MKDLKQAIISYSSKDLEHRKNWYSPVAEAYKMILEAVFNFNISLHFTSPKKLPQG
ncbi:hypothetical protein [Nostoc sp. NZL]|uniref:hypothetical protein n=1 Tax=Nostoc sp. NZL TaxID=2650612 RepID=UPI001E2CD615|nr:hypothetical protein [Nostoc sp. NZL]